MRLPASSATVLIVDDEPDSLRMLTAALETEAITVLVAKSGEAAIELLSNVQPDLIIMDAIMPGIDGFETTRQIKQNPFHAPIPVIFLTGLTESHQIVKGFAAGGVDYVRKPVDIAELLARVGLHLANSRAINASMASLDATGRLMMATDLSGRMLWCTPQAESAISDLAPDWRRSDDRGLPPGLRDALTRLLAAPASVGATLRIPFQKGPKALEVALVARYRENEALIRLSKLDPDHDVARMRARLPLTQREAEVLRWVSYGKASSDISDLLTISPRTVQKHLERIYEKLGVETRSAAAAIAIRAIGQ